MQHPTQRALPRSFARQPPWALVGAALRQGLVASLDQPVVDLVAEWRQRNPDPRAQAITLRHLLSMTAGFQVNDAAGTARPLAAQEAVQKRMAAGGR